MIQDNADSEHTGAARIHGELGEISPISSPAGHLPGVCSQFTSNKTIPTPIQADSGFGVLQRNIGASKGDSQGTWWESYQQLGQQYYWPPCTTAIFRVWQSGLSGVPLGSKPWLHHEARPRMVSVKWNRRGLRPAVVG